MSSDILFNSAQLSAISHGQGPALVIAGPGSGKTAVITARIQYLTDKLHIPPDNILVLTFTRMAAEEMRKRYAAICCRQSGPYQLSINGTSSNRTGSNQPIYRQSHQRNSVTFGTFHSIFWKILARETSLKSNSILTDWEQKIFIKRCLLKIGEYGYTRLAPEEVRRLSDDDISEYASMLSIMANEENDRSVFGSHTENDISVSCSHTNNDISAYGSHTENDIRASDSHMENYRHIPERKVLYRLYREEKRKNARVDYDDMALECIKLFDNEPDILKKWQERFSYILIDEYQDINRSQYQVLKQLGMHGNVFVVGDDDQSIYGFRGASPGFMTEFIRDYPKTVKYFLNTNYRCGEEIITAAGRLISNNRIRMDKNILPGTFRKGKVEIIEVPDKVSERKMILEKTRKFHNDGVPYGRIALLARKNFDLTGFSNMFASAGVPILQGKTGNSWKGQDEVKDLAAYMAMAVGPVKRSDFIRVMNKPLRRLDKYGLDSEIMSWKDIMENYTGPEYDENTARKIRKMQFDICTISQLAPEMVFPYLINVVGYECRNQDLISRINSEALRHDTVPDFLRFLRDDTLPEDNDGITLTTYHGSKGLEFTVVFLPMLNDGVVPEPRAIGDDSLEEERRMLYVAMTRAKDKLIMSYPKMVSGKYKKPSPFLEEL